MNSDMPPRLESTPFRSATLVEPPALPSWPRATLAWAIGVLLGDVVFSGGTFLYAYFILVAVVYVLPRSAWLLVSRRGIELRALGRRTAIWLVAALAAFGVSHANRSCGFEREGVVIRAVERYRGDTGQYPINLEALVPRYLASVPRTRPFPGMFANFNYDRYGDDAHLSWTLVPPFGRPFYVFSERRHGYLD